jgi:hypothetical protein
MLAGVLSSYNKASGLVAHHSQFTVITECTTFQHQTYLATCTYTPQVTTMQLHSEATLTPDKYYPTSFEVMLPSACSFIVDCSLSYVNILLGNTVQQDAKI